MNLLNLILVVFFVIFLIVIGKILLNKKKTFTSINDNIEAENKKKIEQTVEQNSSEKIENEKIQKDEAKKEQKINLPEEIKILQNDIEEIMKLVEKDIENAMNEYDMDEDTIKEMYKELATQFDNQKISIYNYLEQQELALLEREIHSLKGATLNLKFNITGNAIKYIDDLLKAIEQNERLEEKENVKLYIDILFEAKEKIFKNL